MSERSIEVHGPDVEAAIDAGLAQLGVERSDVIIEVVEEGRKGLLGLGSREATVRLTPLPQPEPRPASPSEAPAPPVEPEKEAPRVEAQAAEVQEVSAPEPESRDDDEEQNVEDVARDIVRSLLDKMGFEGARITVTQSEPDDKTGRVMTVLNVEGDDVGSLIGTHGETLNDFQYVARLMAGHALRRRADFLIDVDGYRQQRKEALTSLAHRMANKAVERGSPVTLEPMSAYDRRIVHMALRDHDEVYTNSVGEGDNRRVRIYLQVAEAE
ncbi:MAG TPA: RNA-binding cell elongation regulator Jag/EloR [Candidatus Sulfomarinibacteraceae bacterium]|nr:RNA-binding cell elongation regulator Jag/EloR [Candidatus Sulfomarinibacteraceae bacterium]